MTSYQVGYVDLVMSVWWGYLLRVGIHELYEVLQTDYGEPIAGYNCWVEQLMQAVSNVRGNHVHNDQNHGTHSK